MGVGEEEEEEEEFIDKTEIKRFDLKINSLSQEEESRTS